MPQTRKVVIVGAGFAGLKAGLRLAKDSRLEILIIDRRNYHLFQPLLYQVAMAALSPAEIAFPIRSIFSTKKNVKVQLGNVKSVDLANKSIKTNQESVNYDYLILACGAKHSYFNHPDWEEFAPGLKTLEQATEIRRRVLLAYELAEKEKDIEKQKQLLTFVVVGGGPTGVELAGALGEMSRFTLARDFRSIKPDRTRVILLEAGPRILASFPEPLSDHAARDLESLGVQIWTSSRVTTITESGVNLGNEKIAANTVIWAAGVQPSSLNKSLQSELDQQGRVLINADLSLPKHPEVFVLGDQSHFPTSDGKGLPGLAPVAMQQGLWAAENILCDLDQQMRTEFKYVDKGSMATIGRRKAILQMRQLQMTGFWAWFTWLFVHIYYLIGFKNRLFVFLDWMWAYFSFRRGARLIVDKEWRSSPKSDSPS